jgi:NAD(P)-dependent dehydrogenase (short-subunit alcohol dehydrogenase family)
MRIMVVGGTGTIGRAIVSALGKEPEIIVVGNERGAERVDIADPASIQALYRRVGKVDAVVSSAGQAAFKPLTELSDADFELSLRSKLLGQVNLVRYGIGSVRDGGCFTLTSGILAREPSPGSAAVSLVNAGLEAFGRAAALEMPRGIRINVVSPGWVSETLKAMGRDPSTGTPAATVARAYVSSVYGRQTGAVIDASGGL